MGFLDHTTNNIIVDAVLTDTGRKKLADASTGGLKIIKYAFADNEVDYTLLEKYGEIVGKEKIEKNTPIFEASTSLGEEHYTLLKDESSGAMQQILVTAAATPTSGADLTIQIVGKNYLVGDYNFSIYFNSNVITPYDYSGTTYSSGISNNIKVVNQSKTIGSGGGDITFTFAFVKQPSNTFATGAVKEAHVVVKSDSGTMSNASNFTLTF